MKAFVRSVKKKTITLKMVPTWNGIVGNYPHCDVRWFLFLFFLFGLSKVYGSTKHFLFLRDGIETRYVLFGTERIEKQVTE